MRRIILATTLTCLAFGLGTIGPALAEVECSTPMENWQPVANLRAEAVKLGWVVVKVRADDGCYHVKATDKDGKPVEGVFDPQTLKLLGRSDEDHETNGDHDAPKQGSSD